MKSKLKSGLGFTIIELLVVMAIIAIISGLSLANWRGGEKQYALLRAANKLTQDIRRAENLAMSAKEFQGQIPKGGYGIYFKIQEKNHYILFADLNGNQQYNSGSDGLVEDIKIEKDIEISQLSASPLTITFTPPDPTVTIRPDAQNTTITLAVVNDPTKTKTIKVTKSGLVYVETQPGGTCYVDGTACSTAADCCSTYCYVDADGDCYAPISGAKKCQPSSQLSGTDCYDVNPNARPGQTNYFTTDRGDGSYDYDCDSTITKSNCTANICTASGPGGACQSTTNCAPIGSTVYNCGQSFSTDTACEAYGIVYFSVYGCRYSNYGWSSCAASVNMPYGLSVCNACSQSSLTCQCR
jgi:prepilin-type N-terminal cleavage/methylation domain-containing protein